MNENMGTIGGGNVDRDGNDCIFGGGGRFENGDSGGCDGCGGSNGSDSSDG